MESKIREEYEPSRPNDERQNANTPIEKGETNMEEQSIENQEVANDEQVNDDNVEKSLLEKAKEIQSTVRMIGRLKDESKMLDYLDQLDEILPKLDNRIQEIKQEGQEKEGQVNELKKLYQEGKQLSDYKEKLEVKRDAINEKLQTLTAEQKDFFDFD